MTEKVNRPEWVWVVVEKDPDRKTFLALEEGGQLLAIEEETRGLNFIPVFRSQEEGQAGWHGLAKKPGVQYELQAMRLAEVVQAARASGFDIYILDQEGRVQERMSPGE